MRAATNFHLSSRSRVAFNKTQFCGLAPNPASVHRIPCCVSSMPVL
jgi:hypothetical protein